VKSEAVTIAHGNSGGKSSVLGMAPTKQERRSPGTIFDDEARRLPELSLREHSLSPLKAKSGDPCRRRKVDSSMDGGM